MTENTYAEQQIATLKTKAANLRERDRDFAFDLIDNYERRQGTLSEKQWYWVNKLIERAEGTDNRPSVIDISGAELVAFMDRAADAGLKYPKIKLTCNGEPLVISRASNRSKAPGSLVVTDGGPFGDNVYYGRIARDGTFTHNPRTCTDAHVKVLRALATKPAETAAAYGQRTGNCCFCRRDLEDYRSVSVGYGPVCAERYGLPWGKVQGNPSEYKESEFTQVLHSSDFEGASNAWCCNNCGAHAETPDAIEHHATCKPGEAERWEKHYADFAAEEAAGKYDHLSNDDIDDAQRDIYGEPPWSEDRIAFEPQNS